jgi:hypothetical protein
MNTFDISSIITRLRLDLEMLYQANNQLIFIGRSWPTSSWLTMQAGNRLHYCITDLSGVITDLSKWPSEAQYCGFGALVLCSPVPYPEPLKAASCDPDLFQYLTVQECMELANIEHTRQSIISAWKFVEDQKRAFIEMAEKRKGQKDQ